MKIAFLLTVMISSVFALCSASCHLELLDACGKEVKAFEAKAKANGVDFETAECGLIQKTINCNVEKQCSSDLADALRYSTFQFAVVFKKLLCRDLKYGKLKKMVDGLANKLDVPDLETLPVDKDCATQILRDCYASFTKNIASNNNFCSSIRQNIKCYSDGLVGSDRCSSEFLRGYVKVLSELLGHTMGISQSDSVLCNEK